MIQPRHFSNTFKDFKDDNLFIKATLLGVSTNWINTQNNHKYPKSLLDKC